MGPRDVMRLSDVLRTGMRAISGTVATQAEHVVLNERKIPNRLPSRKSSVGHGPEN